jgi:hypothetical protein
MYCPKCGLQQASEQQRFCSRCGFALGGVIELVAAGGALTVSDKKESARGRSARYEGVRQGVILLMLAVVLLPLVGIIGPPYHEALVFVLMLAGIMRAGYALIFLEGAAGRGSGALQAGESHSAAAELDGRAPAAALPPARRVNAADLAARRPGVAEGARPLSVTESTTRLLEDE